MSYYDIFINAMFNWAGLVLGIIIGIYLFGIVNGFLTGLLSIFNKNKKTTNAISEKEKIDAEAQKLNELFMDILKREMEKEDKENDNNNG